MLYTSPRSRFELIASVVIATDCIGSCKSNYHVIAAMTAPVVFQPSNPMAGKICEMFVKLLNNLEIKTVSGSGHHHYNVYDKDGTTYHLHQAEGALY